MVLHFIISLLDYVFIHVPHVFSFYTFLYHRKFMNFHGDDFVAFLTINLHISFFYDDVAQPRVIVIRIFDVFFIS